MNESLIPSLSLIDVSGYLIIGAILVLLALAIGLTVLLRARYAGMSSDLQAHGKGTGSAFTSNVLNTISRDAMAALRRTGGEINTQAIIEHNFQSELRGMLIGERFVKTSTGLMIILGLVGTFYGLTLSIGRLSALVSGNEATDVGAITESLTAGLTQALTGMSVAFSTSLFGILSAVVMTLLSVFFSVADRRGLLMAQIEAYLDNVLLSVARPPGALGVSGGGGAGLDGMVAAFGQSVAQLDGSVQRFEAALVAFSTTTRDFREFNLHLKDNVQRMSLSFGELSDTLQEHTRSLRVRGPE